MTAQLWTLTFEHLLLTLLAVGLAASLAIPAAVGLRQQPRLARPLLQLADVTQTIPSLALFGLLLPLPLVGGVGPRLAVVVLVLYAVLPILRNTLLGLKSIPADVLEAADALGLTPAEKLREVELPLAAPAILTGLRLATVTTIGTATIGAAIGAGGLGVLLYRGLATVDTELLLAGALPAALLALLADRFFLWIEGFFSPPSA